MIRSYSEQSTEQNNICKNEESALAKFRLNLMTILCSRGERQTNKTLKNNYY